MPGFQGRRSLSCRASSAQVGFFVVELEVDQRSQHLKIRNQSIELGRITRFAVKVSNDSFWIAFLKRVTPGTVRIDLREEIRLGVGDLLVGIGNADGAADPKMCGNIIDVDVGL